MGFAARSGVFLEETFFDGFIVLALNFFHVVGGRVGLEIFKGSFDSLLDFLVFSGAFSSLARCFLCGFDNRHVK